MSKTRNALQIGALTILRVIAGIIMVVHGWSKLTAIEATQESFANMGIPSPEITVWLALAGEFLGGLGLIVGFLTPLAAAGVLAVMIGAIFTVHLGNGLMAQNNGFEYPMLIAAVAGFLIFRGAGPVSVDAIIARAVRSKRTERKDAREERKRRAAQEAEGRRPLEPAEAR